MRLVACARALNEIGNVESFLHGYGFADRIIISDGGSTDGTLEILERHPLVTVHHFEERLACPQDGTKWMNPENAHHNFLMDRVAEEQPDWVIYDDMDCHPNALLRESARWLIENAPGNIVNAYRLYVWMDNSYFPRMSAPGQSLWAWRPDEISLDAIGKDPFSMEYELRGDKQQTNLDLPMCLLHRSWPTPEAYKEKWARYAAWGRPQRDAVEAWGPPENLPEWAHE